MKSPDSINDLYMYYNGHNFTIVTFARPSSHFLPDSYSTIITNTKSNQYFCYIFDIILLLISSEGFASSHDNL